MHAPVATLLLARVGQARKFVQLVGDASHGSGTGGTKTGFAPSSSRLRLFHLVFSLLNSVGMGSLNLQPAIVSAFFQRKVDEHARAAEGTAAVGSVVEAGKLAPRLKAFAFDVGSSSGDTSGAMPRALLIVVPGAFVALAILRATLTATLYRKGRCSKHTYAMAGKVVSLSVSLSLFFQSFPYYARTHARTHAHTHTHTPPYTTCLSCSCSPLT